MTRILPILLPRVLDEWAPPVAATQFPGQAPRFLHGDPRTIVPQTCGVLAEAGELLPHGADQGDLLLAPMPAPGEETVILLPVLEQCAPQLPVIFYARDVPVLGNLRCGSEELIMLPAQRMLHLLRGSMWAEKKPGPLGSLQNRVFLSLALDHWRSLIGAAQWSEHPRLVGEVRLDGELDLLPGARAAELFRDGAQAWSRTRPSRVHLPWWAGRRLIDWKINAVLARLWPREWTEVEVQVRIGRRYRRCAAAQYFAVFRQSGSSKRLLVGGPQLGAKELAALADAPHESVV